MNARFGGVGARSLTVLTSKMLREVVKAQAEGEEGKSRGKQKPLVENVRLQKEKLIAALCKISYDLPDICVSMSGYWIPSWFLRSFFNSLKLIIRQFAL